MSATTIEVEYSCDLCGIVERALQVAGREPGADICAWMDSVILEIARDHRRQSRFCRAKRLQRLKIPVAPGGGLGEAR